MNSRSRSTLGSERRGRLRLILSGMLALGQVKALQVEQKRKAQLIDKATNPPMVAPTSLKTQRVSLLLAM